MGAITLATTTIVVTIFTAMSVADLLASIIALYIFFRLARLYIKLGEPYIGILSAGFLLMFMGLILSGFYYISAVNFVWQMQSQMPEWMWQMHKMMGEHMWRWMPEHWPMMAQNLNAVPIPWLGLRTILLIAYTLILASYITSRIELGNRGGVAEDANWSEEQNVGKLAAFAPLPIAPLLVGINTVAFIVLVAILAIVYIVYRGARPEVILGYILLALSHLIEVLVAGNPSISLMLLSEALRPIALFSIAIGVSYERSK